MSTPTPQEPQNPQPQGSTLTQKLTELPAWAKALAAALAVALIFFLFAPRPADTSPENNTVSSGTRATATPSAEPTQEPTPAPTTAERTCLTPEEVDTTNPDEVATAYGLIAYCLDATVDPNMTAGALRAAPLMTDRLIELTNMGKDVRPGAGGAFAQAYASKAVSIPQSQIVNTHGVELHDHNHAEGDASHDHVEPEVPEQLTGMQQRTINVTWQWATEAGNYLPGGKNVITLILLPQEDGTWKIDATTITYAEGI